MEATSQTAEETLKEICLWRPALRTILETFAPLLTKIDALTDVLASNFVQEGIKLPSCSQQKLQQGVSILADCALPDLGKPFAWMAEAVLPELKVFPNLDLTNAESLFSDLSPQSQALLIQAVTANDAALLTDFAQSKMCEPAMLLFLAQFPVSLLLKALVKNYTSKQELAPWDENNIWQQGYCPVCGSYPTIGWLDKPVIDERNTYLLEGGGRKHLHCGVCGANWRFLRLACPNCGVNKSKQIEILTEEQNTHGESLDWCTQCRCYCPIVDLRERLKTPHLDAEAIGMLHLYLHANEQQLTPLRVSYWNIPQM